MLFFFLFGFMEINSFCRIFGLRVWLKDMFRIFVNK